jgi:hypothetical protein
MNLPRAGLRIALVSMPAFAILALNGGCGEVAKDPVVSPPVVSKSDAPLSFENPYNTPSKAPGKGKR